MFNSLLKIKNFKLKIAIYILLFLVFIFSSISVVSAATISKTLQRPVNNIGLVGYWTFDGKDMSPNVLDSSGQGNHGNLFGQTSTTTTPGKIGQALKFDGSDDNVSLGTASVFNLTTTGTYSAWFYHGGADGTVFGRGNFASDLNSTWIEVYQGRPACEIGNGSSSDFIHAATNLVTNKWYHVACTWDGSQFKIYVNGSSDATPVSQTVTPDTSGQALYIGNITGLTRPYTGQIDDVRMYNRALSSSEVSQLYNLGVSSKTSKSMVGGSSLPNGLLGYWTFDGKDMSPNVRDSSGQGNHGNLSGQTSTTTAPGKIGQALSFDGVDDVASTTLDFAGLSAFTVSQWVYAKNPDQYDTVWSADGSSAGCLNGEGVYFSGPTTLNFRVAGAGDDAVTVPNIKNKWTHVVSTYNATNRRVYFDNVLVYDQTGGAATTGDVDFQIGAYNDCTASPNDNFEGLIDDTRVYSRVISSAEITELYGMGIPSSISKSITGDSQLSNGLVGYWTFDGPKMVPNVLDSSGQGNHGNLSGQTSTTTTPGKIGQAISLDGTNDYIDMGNTASLNLGSTGSVAFWAKWTASGNYFAPLAKMDLWDDLEGYGFFTSNSDQSVVLALGDATSYTLTSSPGSLNDGKWHHFIGTWDGTTVRMYADGVQSSSNAQTITPVSNVWPFYIGADPSGDTLPFPGQIDDVRVYNRSLSASEILKIYNKGRR